jgi:copper chaperone CopZ
MDTVRLSINGMTCGHCVTSVRGALASVPGVEVQDVRVGSAEVRFQGAQAEAVLAAVQDVGYDATIEAAPSGTSTGNPTGPASASTAEQKGAAGCACCVPSAAPTPLTSARRA